MAVINLVDVAEMRHIAHVKRSDTVGLAVAFGATLLLGIELGILVAVVASMLVVFARMSKPHTATLGRIPGTTSYRNIDRFPEALRDEGISLIRIDAAMSFANAQFVKNVIRSCADRLGDTAPHALVLDCSGINDVDATGAATLDEIFHKQPERI